MCGARSGSSDHCLTFDLIRFALPHILHVLRSLERSQRRHGEGVASTRAAGLSAAGRGRRPGWRMTAPRAPSSQIVRVQSRAGTRRLTAPASLTLQQFLELVVREFGLEQSNEFSLFRAPGRRDELTRAHLSSPLENIPIWWVRIPPPPPHPRFVLGTGHSVCVCRRSATPRAVGLGLPCTSSISCSHGDMLYLVDSVGGLVADNTVKEVPATEAPPTSGVEEDEVDRILAQRDGKVYRKKDPQLFVTPSPPHSLTPSLPHPLTPSVYN